MTDGGLPRPEPRAGGAQPRPLMDRFLRWLGRLVLDAFYRRIEMVGADKVPAQGPLIVVANHSNSLVDGAVIISYLPRMSRFLGASTVWDYRPIRPLLNAAGVVPLHRRQDGRADQGALTESFSQASDLLQAGGVLALFPEGISHNNPRVLPLKSGAARIALETETTRGPLGLTVLPVCLTFEEKYRVRTRALIEIGDPIALLPDELDGYRSGQRAAKADAIRALTARVQDSLEAMTPARETWEEARLVARAADMLAEPGPGLAPQDDLAGATANRRSIQAGYVWARDQHPERTDKLRQDLADYDGMLRATGLRDDQLASGASIETPAGGLGRLLWLGMSAPVAVLGLVLNLLPFLMLRALSRRKDLDKRSTWSIFAGFFVFPIFWILSFCVLGLAVASLRGSSAGWPVGLALLFLAPLTGRISLIFLDRLAATRADRRARLALRSPTDRIALLIRKRGLIRDELTELAALFRTAHPATEASKTAP